MDTTLQFNTLLEQYVFDVAAKFIDIAADTERSRMITFFQTIGKSASGTNPSESINPPFDVVGEHLKQQWEGILRKPVSAKPTRTVAVKNVLLHSISMNQTQIDDTTVCINRMEGLIQKAEATIRDQKRKIDLIGHYQHIKSQYTLRLRQLLAFRQKTLGLLDRY